MASLRADSTVSAEEREGEELYILSFQILWNRLRFWLHDLTIAISRVQRILRVANIIPLFHFSLN